LNAESSASIPRVLARLGATRKDGDLQFLEFVASRREQRLLLDLYCVPAKAVLVQDEVPRPAVVVGHKSGLSIDELGEIITIAASISNLGWPVACTKR
jgi:hypothetical protein